MATQGNITETNPTNFTGMDTGDRTTRVLATTTETYLGSGTGTSLLSNRTWFAETITSLPSGVSYLSDTDNVTAFFQPPTENQSVYFSETITPNSSVYWCLNDTALPHDEDFYEFYENARFVTGLILYPCICIPGLMGNFLTLLVLSDRNMRTSTNAFLSALAVADSIKLINDLLYFCTILLLRMDDDVGNRAYGYLYPYAHFIFSMSVCVSSWLTVSVAVERYIMVCHPTKARGVCNRARAVVVCVAVFVVMTTLALPSALR
ncbi:FMRFamide receptor-like [Littorina saxatilis]|uniref:FMRFamide receptor-like n=1 Tax=Littorina saxatilis TaxID=31220 RepID=UPI0038B4680D